MAYSHDSSPNEQADIFELVRQYERCLSENNAFFFESDAFQEIIQYYDALLETPKALDAIAYAIEQHPFCAQFYFMQAQILMDEERYEDAQDAIDTARRYEPTNPEFLLAEADLLQRTKQYDAALEMLAQLRLWADEDELQESDILEATILEALKDYDAALRKLEKTAQQDPDNDWLLSRIWLCAEWADKRDQAVIIYQRLVDENPYSYWCWYHLGYAFMELELYEKAVEALDYALVIDEEFELAYRDIVEALLALQSYDEALRYLQEYTSHFELDAEMHEFMGECYEGKGDSALARSYYIQSAQMNARDGNSYFRLGGCYAKEGNWKSALAALELAIQTDPANELYYLALAEAHYELGNTEKAQELLLIATEKAPNSAHVWLCYIEFLLYENEYELALDVLQQAGRSCEDEFALDCGRCAVLFHLGHFQECRILLDRLSVARPEAAQRIEEISSFISNHPLWLQWKADS